MNDLVNSIEDVLVIQHKRILAYAGFKGAVKGIIELYSRMDEDVSERLTEALERLEKELEETKS